MNIHEYQARDLLASAGVAVPRGAVARTPEEAESIARSLPCNSFVVKAQVHAGGRGKGTFKDGFISGVHLVKTPAQVRDVAARMLGNQLITHQTGPEGKPVHAVLVGESTEIARELYLAITLDRVSNCPVLIASREGGVEIETVAEKTPPPSSGEKIDPGLGLQPYEARKASIFLGFPSTGLRAPCRLIHAVYRLFLEKDCSQVEINPLAVTKGGDVVALDAKLNFDDNALFRHKEIESLRDASQEDPRDLAAAEHHLNYIGLDGNIGCMVNGAGLAMATMDLLQAAGGRPANFLDVGGGASEQQITAAFKLLQTDPHVRVIFINIFGGILKCDVLAHGIVAACRTAAPRVPVIVRLQGTNVEEGRKVLRESGLKLTAAEGLMEAAQKAVAAAGGNKMSVLVDANTRLLVQGITGKAGSFHARACLEYGTRVVAGVTPARGGEKFEEKIPIYDTVAEAVHATGANASMIFVPPEFAGDAILEAADAGIQLIVTITEGIPVLDMMRVRHALEAYPSILIGPNCPGIITPGACKIGIMPGYIHRPGRVGVVSRSGTLTYEAVWQITSQGLGQSTCIGVGGDPIHGLTLQQAVEYLHADPDTHAIVMIGEIGGSEEEEAAEYIRARVKKPVVGFIAGATAPPGRRMGHAGAIISGGRGTAQEKIEALKKAGIRVAHTLAEIGTEVAKALGKAK